MTEPYDLRLGDSREVLRAIPDNSVDSVVCDPPYALVSIVKRFGAPGAAAALFGTDGAFARVAAGFMGQAWDTGETAFAAAFWAEVYRVLKPGGYLLAFSGTRTQHRMVCAIEDAGFDIRDQIGWAFGQGFPKSHDAERAVARFMCKCEGRHYERKVPDDVQPGDHVCAQTPESLMWGGFGTALKPAWEPICLARKTPVGTVAENIAAWGVGALNIDGCRIDFAGEDDEAETKGKNAHAAFGSGPRDNNLYSAITSDRADYDPPGRWPANLIHDGSPEVVDAFPDSVTKRIEKPSDCDAGGDLKFGTIRGHRGARGYDGSGSAARFFYCAKASGEDRAEGLPEGSNTHPTVKPTALMRYLCRLVTPPGGVVLDPFMGSGSTGKAAMLEGFRFIGIEREAEYMEIAQHRVAFGRRAALLPVSARPKAKPKPVPAGQGDLFG